MFERTYTKLGISNYLKGIKSMISTEKTRKESLTKDKSMYSDTSKDIPHSAYMAIHLCDTY